MKALFPEGMLLLGRLPLFLQQLTERAQTFGGKLHPKPLKPVKIPSAAGLLHIFKLLVFFLYFLLQTSLNKHKFPVFVSKGQTFIGTPPHPPRRISMTTFFFAWSGLPSSSPFRFGLTFRWHAVLFSSLRGSFLIFETCISPQPLCSRRSDLFPALTFRHTVCICLCQSLSLHRWATSWQSCNLKGMTSDSLSSSSVTCRPQSSISTDSPEEAKLFLPRPFQNIPTKASTLSRPDCDRCSFRPEPNWVCGCYRINTLISPSWVFKCCNHNY